MRIAVGGIHTECSTYSPVLMQTEDFRVLRGDALTNSDYFGFLGDFDAQVAPLFHARAVPGGPLARETYEAFKTEFLERLEAAKPFDAVYLAMHGAMHVDGMFDAEGDWIAAVRAAVGPDMLIAASYDLHGNVSQKIVDQIDIFAAYRTAPHIDVAETMNAAYKMLLWAAKSGQRPGVVRVPVPHLLPGERSSTEDEPGRSLYAALPQHETPDVWRTDLMIGYVWADEPRATACAVVTGTNKTAAEAAGRAIAQSFWNARDDFRFGPTTGPLDKMLDIAAKSKTTPVILADSGDNPTGGGVGDRGDVLSALIDRNWQDALIAGITDAPAVAACFDAGKGQTITLTIGGSLDPAGGKVTVDAEIVTLHPGDTPNENQAVVQIGGIRVVLAARRRPYHNIADFTLLGLDPTKVQLLVVKSGYLSPELAPIANPNLMALTDGVVNQDIPKLANTHRTKGVLPFETPRDFTPVAQSSARFSG
ncbi:M81 family metallopeptidase [Loktanella sp. S4079]|uniref:M81 family metallopeptidase n=1 Tax=Loktanella sp. S4079 TaxID=579483 RepID=UPI0005F9A9B8|nr:M81 family metallopeptidase [Loktanella sp. S4079]KJZ18478.1 microcystin degradation protein MlrC [Loktanella sp. S4079]